MGSIVYFSKTLIHFGGTAIQQISQLALYTIIGILVYFGLARFLNLEESDMIWNQIRRIR